MLRQDVGWCKPTLKQVGHIAVFSVDNWGNVLNLINNFDKKGFKNKSADDRPELNGPTREDPNKRLFQATIIDHRIGSGLGLCVIIETIPPVISVCSVLNIPPYFSGRLSQLCSG